MSAVVVIARLHPREGSAEALEGILAELIPAVHEEPGCTLYAAHRDLATGDVVFVERYTGAEAYAAHRDGSALALHGPRLAAHLDGDVEVAVLEPILGGGDAKGLV